MKPNIPLTVLAGILALGTAGKLKADTGAVKVFNYSSSVPYTSVNCGNSEVEGVLDGKDPFDAFAPESPNPDELQAFTNPYGEKWGLELHPLNSTAPFYVQLGVKGYISSVDNSLKLKVLDASGYENRILTAQEVWNASQGEVQGAIHEIPKDGSIYTIPLPDVVDQGEGVYRIFKISPERKIKGDINDDGEVNLKDYALLAKEWLVTSIPDINGGDFNQSDINHNGTTGLEDLVDLLVTWLDVIP